MILLRKLILERVAAANARTLSIVAPAGFGKTTTAEMIAGSDKVSVMCDVAGVSDVHSFARRIIRAIRDSEPRSHSALASDLFVHLQPGVTNVQLAGFVLDAWISTDTPMSWIFDNLEAIADQPASLDLLIRLIKGTQSRRLILSARPPFALVNSRLLPPNAQLRLRVDDLAFSYDEMRSLFETSVDEANLERVAALTQGWPVAVLLLRQIAHEGYLERVLAATSGSRLDDLREYLLNEVLDALPASHTEALLALIATRANTVDAVVRATDGRASPAVLAELSGRFALVLHAADDCYRVHPLIVSALEPTSGPVIDVLRLAAARSYERDELTSEAAELYLDAGREKSAAACLERATGTFLQSSAFVGVEDLLERIPTALLPYYPRLWAALAFVRRAVVRPEILLAEALAIRESLRSDRQTLEAKQVNALLIMLATHLGDHALAEEVLAECDVVEAYRTPGDAALLIAKTMRAMLTGRTQGALQSYRGLLPHIENDLVRAYFSLRVETVIATMNGCFDDARRGQLRAAQQAAASGKASQLAGLAHHQAVLAWLAGDDAAVEGFFDQIAGMSSAVNAIDYAALAHAWSTGESRGIHGVTPRTRAFALLLMAGRATSGERRAELLVEAERAAREADDLWSQLLIAVACAMAEARMRGPLLERALEIARAVGQPALEQSVRSLIEGSDGHPTLVAIARRFSFEPPHVTHHESLHVHALAQTVSRGGAPIVLSQRVRSFVIALAVLKRVGRDDLIDLIWGQNLGADTNALKMLVSRARHQLGDATLIEIERGQYALRADVTVDVNEIDRLLRKYARHEPLAEQQRETLRDAYDRFTESGAVSTAIPSLDASIDAMRRRVIERLARDALDRDEIGFAFELADDLRRKDASDEAAYELMIRAYVRSGNNASALREYRHYSAHLINDLGIEPPSSLDELLASDSRVP